MYFSFPFKPNHTTAGTKPHEQRKNKKPYWLGELPQKQCVMLCQRWQGQDRSVLTSPDSHLECSLRFFFYTKKEILQNE